MSYWSVRGNLTLHEELLLYRDLKRAFVQKCPEYLKLTPNPKEPLLTTPLPKHPGKGLQLICFNLMGQPTY